MWPMQKESKVGHLLSCFSNALQVMPRDDKVLVSAKGILLLYGCAFVTHAYVCPGTIRFITHVPFEVNVILQSLVCAFLILKLGCLQL